MSPRASAPRRKIRCDLYLLNGWLTILNSFEDSVNFPEDAALRALAWVLSDTARAQRLLDLTGLTPDGLRATVGAPSTQRAVLDFLCAHEPDLLAAADALALDPAELAAARGRIAP